MIEELQAVPLRDPELKDSLRRRFDTRFLFKRFEEGIKSRLFRWCRQCRFQEI